jgi:hypothetical protein
MWQAIMSVQADGASQVPESNTNGAIQEQYYLQLMLINCDIINYKKLTGYSWGYANQTLLSRTNEGSN